MTVAELIAELSKIEDQYAPVHYPGAEYDEPVSWVMYEADGFPPYVLLH